MEAAVFDTYVRRKDGHLMHFDIIVPAGTDFEAVIAFGRDYLVQKGLEGQPLSAKECRFCHIERLRPPMEAEIVEKGHYILEMEGC